MTPNKFLDGVAELEVYEMGFTISCIHRTTTIMLDLFDEVSLGSANHGLTFLVVKVYVLTPAFNLTWSGTNVRTQFISPLDGKFNDRILEGHEGKGESGVSIEEEDEGKNDRILFCILCLKTRTYIRQNLRDLNSSI